MKRTGLVSIGVLFLFAVAGYSQVTTGTISGIVTDSTAAVLAGASIIVQNEDTGIVRAVSSDEAGRYTAPLLGLGNYRVTASMEGFQTEVRRGIVLTVGREAIVNLELAVGTISQTVEVTGEAPLVETTDSAVGYLVNDRTVRDLPLNGRDLTQLVLLNPGVNVGVNGPTGNAYSGWAKKISISGMREEHNAYLLDGSYINDMNHHIPSGPSGALLGVETVREFQVLTNAFGAQYGRALGGVLNAVSKSGTNDWHGNVYEFLRNSALDARNFFDLKKVASDPRLPPFRRNQFGGTIGGPIIEDKAFFFAAYEGMRESLTNTIINVVPDENSRSGILPTKTVTVSEKIKPYLPYFPLPSPQGKNFGDGTAQYIFQAPQPTQDDFGQGRIDHQVSDKDSLFARYTASNSSRSLVTSYPDFHTLQLMSVKLLTLSETHIVSPRMLNTVHFSFSRVVPIDAGTFPDFPSNLLSVPGQPPPGLNPGSGITGWEGFANAPSDRWTTNRFAYKDDVTFSMGGHSLQFGGMAERMQFNGNFPNRPYGSWTFSSLENFLQGIVNTYRGTPPQFGSSIRGFRQWFFAMYLQDDWKATPSLTLNMGLRWEPYTVATEVNGLISNQRHLMDPTNTAGDPFWLNHSMKDFGPRLGFAWSPFASGKLSVRGGAGLLFMPNDVPMYRTQSVRNPFLLPEFSFATTGHFPDALAEIAAARLTTFGVTEGIPFDNLKSPRTLQYNLNLQQQVGASSVVALGYIGARGMNLTSYGNYNVPLAVFNGVSLAIPAGATVFNPAFTAVNYYSTGTNSWYNAVTGSYQHRFAGGFQSQVSYTFSKSLSEADSTGKTQYSGAGGDSGPLFYALDRSVGKALSGFHVAHTFSANYSYDLPFGDGLSGFAGPLLSGWQLTGIVSAQTGQPFGVGAASNSAATALSYSCCRPNRNAGFTKDNIIKGGPDQYFDPAAFSPPGPRELGNAGRNILIGPGLAKLDFGITKDTVLGENLRLQFRTEAFNLLNRANFGLPASSLFTATAINATTGVITPGSPVKSAGAIDRTIATSRQLQLSLKLLF